MIKNNNGVTLVELLIVIVVMGIIAAFSIPAVGAIIENTQKDAIVNDALQVESAAKTYCTTVSTCGDGTTLSWATVEPYISGLNTADYDTGVAGAAIVATNSSGSWLVDLEAVAVGDGTASSDWEFDPTKVPSATSRDDLLRDAD